MNQMYLYNSLTRKKEEFIPIKKDEVGLYTCGPTVYNYAHIGNLRYFLFVDFLKRTLKFNGYKVKHVMNITDVGHLTGDMDMGEDKLEKGAKREGKTAWEVAKFYEQAFLADLEKLNISMPNFTPRATEYIKEQIALIEILEKKGFAYKISDGIYFDTAKFSGYNKLSHLDLETLREGARVEKNEEKRNSTDFALWKFSPSGVKRDMEWDSPWGVGFPGWHIECSAMSQALLRDELDIHCGGIDHINVHHTNEIAQSEAATGHKFFNYWMHGAFLNIQGGKKMAKSADNFLTLENAFLRKGINPLAYRFACLQTSYRKTMEYSEEAMENAVNGLEHLYNQARNLNSVALEANRVDREIFLNSTVYNDFLSAINDDLNTPLALAVVQEMLKSEMNASFKLYALLEFDKVLGLDLGRATKEPAVPQEVLDLIEKRKIARENKEWNESDRLRDEIESFGYLVEDGKDEMRVYKK